ncbi:hypothetical protein Clacol_007022 [Clathrus columnatus]|uniref:Uncharacterized protein n=1 Tax=Clathrus columnatus TaxID=1419009 RepID=A0AAV5AGM8_9AGAM|nr:hypothetical protein Clacol_007022 [Clathrus columnatus]
MATISKQLSEFLILYCKEVGHLQFKYSFCLRHSLFIPYTYKWKWDLPENRSDIDDFSSPSSPYRLTNSKTKGHTRPGLAYAIRLLQETSQLTITFPTPANWSKQIDDEIAKYIPDTQDPIRSRLRIAQIGEIVDEMLILPNFIGGLFPFCTSLFTLTPYQQANGTVLSAIRKPDICLLDLAYWDLFCLIRTFGSKIPILILSFGNTTATLLGVGPEELGGRGDVATKAELLAKETGRNIDEIIIELFVPEKGQITDLVGLPQVYDYECHVKLSILVHNDARPPIPASLRVKLEASDNVLISAWAPQNLILGHKATAWFLTHCGQNSVLESLSHGIPMIAWPVDADQPMNAMYVGDLKHKVGYELLEVLQRDESKPLYRGYTPSGTLNAIEEEFRTVLQNAFGRDGAMKRRNAEMFKEKLSRLWNEDGDARMELRRFIKDHLS